MENDTLNSNKEYFPGNNYVDIKEIRINNSFVNPKKEFLNVTRERLDNYLKKEKNKNILSLLIDTSIVVSSDTHAIIQTEIEATSHLINALLSEIEANYKKVTKDELKFIAISKEEWKDLKEKYVNNLKNKVKYEFVEEKKIEYNNDELGNIANELFAKEKIEVE